MAAVALCIYLAYLAVAFGLRSLLQRRETGSTGFVGISGPVGSAEWLGGVLFVIALALGIAAPVLALADAVPAAGPVDVLAVNVAGLVLVLVGAALSLYAQVAMGASWRIGVASGERTDLVTTGPFAIVRNPFFAAMIPVAAGLVLMVPSVVALAGFAALVAAVELQVRVVEEPHLLRTHPAYRAYARRTGRFVPGVGRITDESG